MAIIHKKVWPEYFEKIISGQKKFELRLADFEVKEGDTLVPTRTPQSEHSLINNSSLS